MCLTVIEILFLAAGLWLLVTGKVPNRLFQILFGKGEYRFTPAQARLFGLLLASPLPMVFAVSFLLAAISPTDQLPVSLLFEIGYDLVVAIIAIVLARRSRQPAAP